MGDEITLKDMEETYKKVMEGSNFPKYIIYFCEACNKVLTLPSDEPCEHLLEIIKGK